MGIFDTARALTMARMLDQKANDVTWDGDRGWTAARGIDEDRSPRKFVDFVTDGWRRNPVVRRCMMELQTSFSEAPIHAYRLTDDGDFERLTDHPAERLFVKPNGRDSGVDFTERLLQHHILGGNGFIRKVRSAAGIPIELRLLRPDRVPSVDVDADGVPVSWEVVVDPSTGKTMTVPAADIIHIPDVDPLNEVYGHPRLASAAFETDTDNEATNYVNEVLRNFGTPGTVVSIDADKVRQSGALERAESRWTEKFGPGRGRGKVAFLPGAQKVQNIGFNLHELEFLDLRNVTRESICSVFGIDPLMVGFGTGAKTGALSGNERKEARRAFWEQTMFPLHRRFSAALQAFLAPHFGENLWLLFDVTDVGALQPDRAADVQRGKDMAETGSYTMKEIRAETGFDPEVDEDARIVVRGAVQYVTLSDEEEDDDDGRGEVPEEFEDGADEDETRSLVEALRSDLDAWETKAASSARAVTGMPFDVTGVPVKSRDARPDAWKRFDDFARSQEPTYRLAAEGLYQRQRNESARLAFVTLREAEERAGPGPTEAKGITPESLDAFRRRLGDRFTAYHREWRRRYDALMSQSVDVVAGRLSGATGLSFNVFNPIVREAVADRLNLIVGADELTFDAIMEVVEAGFVEGLGRNEIAARIQGVFDKGVVVSGGRVLPAAERAKLIATTETTAIANHAAVALLRTTDIPWVKTWLTQGDDRVRPAHAEEEADSEADPVPLEEEFRVTGLMAPGEPNCRCSILAEQSEEVR